MFKHHFKIPLLLLFCVSMVQAADAPPLASEKLTPHVAGSPFMDLPDELRLEVFRNLTSYYNPKQTLADHGSTARTCKEIHRFMSGEAILQAERRVARRCIRADMPYLMATHLENDDIGAQLRAHYCLILKETLSIRRRRPVDQVCYLPWCIGNVNAVFIAMKMQELQNPGRSEPGEVAVIEQIGSDSAMATVFGVGGCAKAYFGRGEDFNIKSFSWKNRDDNWYIVVESEKNNLGAPRDMVFSLEGKRLDL